MNIKDNTVQALELYVKDKLGSFLTDKEAHNTSAILFHHYLAMDRADIILKKNERVVESKMLEFYHAIKKINKGIPVQYVIGETEFYGLQIKVSSGVLIPRPETEELVDWIVKDANFTSRILDIGSGSGCISLAIKKELPKAIVMGCDVSQKALAIAKKNAKRLKLQVNYFHCDILNGLPGNDTYDIVVSNPPYVLEKEKELMEDNVLKNEPHLALFVEDEDPLLFYREIISSSKYFLNPKGTIYFEINEQYGADVEKLFEESGFTNIELRNDLQGKPRMVKAIQS